MFAVGAEKTDARIEQASDEQKRHITYPSFLLCWDKGKQKDVKYILYKDLPHPSRILYLVSRTCLFVGKHADVLPLKSERKLRRLPVCCLKGNFSSSRSDVYFSACLKSDYQIVV